jgi:hypothetical protein
LRPSACCWVFSDRSMAWANSLSSPVRTLTLASQAYARWLA